MARRERKLPVRKGKPRLPRHLQKHLGMQMHMACTTGCAGRLRRWALQRQGALGRFADKACHRVAQLAGVGRCLWVVAGDGGHTRPDPVHCI